MLLLTIRCDVLLQHSDLCSVVIHGYANHAR